MSSEGDWNLGASPQLEYWNNGMMEHWVLGNWDIGPLEKFSIDMGENISENENLPLKTTFQYSIIPFFHVQGINTKPQKTPLTSESCTNSETYI